MKTILFLVLLLSCSNIVLSQESVSLTFGRPDQPHGLLPNYQDQGFSLDPVRTNALLIINPALFMEFGFLDPLTITRIDGGNFNLDSVNWDNFFTPTTIHFEGLRSDNFSFTQRVSMVIGTQDLSAYNLTDLKALTIAIHLPENGQSGTTAIHALNFTVVPEPDPAFLVGTAAAGLLFISRFRRTKFKP